MWLCLVLLGNAPCLSVELSLKGLGVSCPGSPDGSCSCLRSLSCCLMLGPSLEDAFWRKSRRLASLAIVNTNWRKREKGSKKKKKTQVKETRSNWKEEEEGACCRYGLVGACLQLQHSQQKCNISDGLCGAWLSSKKCTLAHSTQQDFEF